MASEERKNIYQELDELIQDDVVQNKNHLNFGDVLDQEDNED